MGDVLPTMTGSRHRRNRAVVANVFFPKKMRQLAETVFADEAQKLVRDLRGRDEVDLVSEFTRLYTFNNITRLLGLPSEDTLLLHDWAERIMRSYIDLPSATAACAEMGEYLTPLVAQRRQSPADDMISLLVQVDMEGQGLSDEEVFGFCRNLFPAAIDTSTNSLGTLLSVVLADPQLKTMAIADDKQREALVQEALRWEPPLVMVPRRCVAQVTLGGHTLQPGDDVRLCLTAANNDAGVFEQPRKFDPHRDNSNLSFGHGEHFCLGSHMARRVLETGLKVLLEEHPDLTLSADKTVEIAGGVLRGPTAVWVSGFSA
jgi:cytochrome P450